MIIRKFKLPHKKINQGIITKCNRHISNTCAPISTTRSLSSGQSVDYLEYKILHIHLCIYEYGSILYKATIENVYIYTYMQHLGADVDNVVLVEGPERGLAVVAIDSRCLGDRAMH